MKKKIFFTDLDGTLLNSKKRLCPETEQLLHKIVKEGHYLALSSGRSLQSIRDTQKLLMLPDENVFLIGFNGGVIYDCTTEKNIAEKRIPFHLVEPVFEAAEKLNIHCQTYTDSNIICKQNTEELETYQNTIKISAIFTPDILSKLQDPPFKILAISGQGAEKLDLLRESIKQTPLLDEIIQTVYSNDHLLEIFPKISGKGSAVYELCRHLNIPLENTMAAGDEQNDVSMLQAVNTSIAMCNGTQYVKDVATHISKQDNNSDGLAPYIREFFEIF